MHQINYNEFLGALKGRVKGKVVIVGIGNELRGDDGFGPYLAEGLRGRVGAKVINSGVSLENYYNPIVKERPDVIILLDSIDFNGPIGEIAVFEKGDILKVGLSTHTMSPRFFIEYMESSIKADIILIGVKPANTSMGEGLSGDVKAAADHLSDFFMRLLPVKGEKA